jgi:peptide/nickel transport system permease protein
VSNLFATRLPATLTVMIPILVLDVLLALPIAMWVAYRRGSLTDRMIMVATTVALSISFLVYVIIGQYVFGFQLGWFPVQGWSDSVLTNLLVYAPLPVMLAWPWALRRRRGCTAASCSTNWARTTCARHAPRA